jgi:hypothetical protein
MSRFRVSWASNGTEISTCFDTYFEALRRYNQMRMCSKRCELEDMKKGILRKTYLRKLEDNIHYERVEELVND